MVALNFSPNNILDIIDKISSIKGIGMEIGSTPKRDDFHHFKYSEVIGVLEKLQEQSIVQNK